MDVAKYKSLFLSESREYINSMSEAVLQLKKQPTPELCDHLFRLAHSIKGLAASMGYTDLKAREPPGLRIYSIALRHRHGSG